MGGFFNEREYSGADWLVPFVPFFNKYLICFKILDPYSARPRLIDKTKITLNFLSPGNLGGHVYQRLCYLEPFGEFKINLNKF